METLPQNGSLTKVSKNVTEYEQEETIGKIKVLIHQDAFDIPELCPKKEDSVGDRPKSFTDTKELPKFCQNTIQEPDDIITPLSEESSPTNGCQTHEDKPSSEQTEAEDQSCQIKIFPCCGELVDPSSFTFGRLIGLLVGFLFYVGNLVSDAIVCYHLFLHGNLLWFVLVAVFTIVPTVILNILSYHLSIKKMVIKRTIWNQSESLVVSIIVALLHLSQFGVLARYLGYIFLHELEYLWVVFCPVQRRKDYDHHSGKYIELPYLPYLFMIEAMLQCLPQIVVQLSILTIGQGVLTTDTEQVLVLSILISLLNLTRLLTTCKHIQKNFSTAWAGLFFLFMWHLFTNISRILSFTLFMTQFTMGFLMLCLFHWIIMSVWAVGAFTSSISCKTWAGIRKNGCKYLKGFLYGFIYLLCFMELTIVDNTESPVVPSRYLYFFFYSVIFLENTVVILLWYVYCSSAWYSIPALAMTFISFFLGVFSMLVYYRYFHKNVMSHNKRWQCAVIFPTRNRVV